MKKASILTLIAVLTIGTTCALVYYTKIESFAFAWALNFLLMFFVVLFTGELKSPLASPYFDEKSWEQKGKIYEYLGVNIYRKLLVLIGWEKLIRKAFPIQNNTESLRKLYHQTKKAELDHIIILLIVLGFNIFVAIKFGFVKSLSLLVLNILFHLYPILLQRYNRPRMARAVKLSERRAVR